MLELSDRGDERHHDLGPHIDAAPLRAHRCLEDRAALHLGDLGILMPSRHPRWPSIGFVSRSDSTMRRSSSRGMPSVRASSLPSSPPCGRNSCSGGSSRRIVPGAVHRLEDSFEVAALHRQQLGQRAPPSGLVARDDHLAHRVDAVALEEHVLGATEPDALGAEAARDARIVRRVGVGAHLSRRTSSAQPSRRANDW